MILGLSKALILSEILSFAVALAGILFGYFIINQDLDGVVYGLIIFWTSKIALNEFLKTILASLL